MIILDPKEKLFKHVVCDSPQEELLLVLQGYRIVHKDAYLSYLWARALAGRFAKGEPAIATSAQYSFMYAKDVLNEPFPLGEPAIAADHTWRGMYTHFLYGGNHV